MLDDSVSDVEPFSNGDSLLQFVDHGLRSRAAGNQCVPLRYVRGAGGSPLLRHLLSGSETVPELQLQPHVVRWRRCPLQTVDPGHENIALILKMLVLGRLKLGGHSPWLEGWLHSGHITPAIGGTLRRDAPDPLNVRAISDAAARRVCSGPSIEASSTDATRVRQMASRIVEP
jgi:hypothetical protein